MLIIKDICEVSELEEIVHANCPEHESWNMILRIEKQAHEGGVLAQRLMNEKKECVGIMQYYYHEGSLLQKPEIEISLLTLFQNPVEYVQELQIYPDFLPEGTDAFLHFAGRSRLREFPCRQL